MVTFEGIGEERSMYSSKIFVILGMMYKMSFQLKWGKTVTVTLGTMHSLLFFFFSFYTPYSQEEQTRVSQQRANGGGGGARVIQ